MRKTKKLFIVICCVVFAIIGNSCEKENVFSTRSMSTPAMSNEIEILYRQMPSRNYSSITVVGDNILKFQSVSHYDQICQQLKADCILWDSLFYAAYGRMEEMELMDWMDSIGYDEYLPIVMFENALGVMGTRLFDSQRDAILEWSENEFKSENPTDKIFIFEWEQALYNEHRELCVGDTIYQFRVDATIKYPLDNIEDWLRIRELPTIELVAVDGVTSEDYLPKSGEGEEKVQFPCYDYGEYNANNYPELLSGIDYSFWIVVGKTGFVSLDNRMESKITNYKYHKTKPNGQKVFVKTPRKCSIITTDQIFYKDHYKGWLFPTFIGTDYSHIVKNLPPIKVQKEAKGIAADLIWPSQPTGLTHWYKRGVLQHPELQITLGEQTFTLTLQLKKGTY